AVKSRMFSGVQRLRSVLGPLLGEFVTDISGGAR
ncbi:MAG: polymerase subunit sigma-24, partial [Pseudonocardia sp.]|nr:polymerase subunit sigma-24 [Pseudonocardia sp.]